jgi:hypothetical protein
LPWLRSNDTAMSKPGEPSSGLPSNAEGNIHSGIGGYEGGSYKTGYLGQEQVDTDDLGSEG